MIFKELCFTRSDHSISCKSCGVKNLLVFSLVGLIMGLLRIIESTILLWLRIHIRALKPLPWKSLFGHVQTILSSCTPIFWCCNFFQTNCLSDLTHLASTYRFAFSVSTVAFKYRYIFFPRCTCIQDYFFLTVYREIVFFF